MMFSEANIREETYPTAFQRGKELYLRGAVEDLSYENYLEAGFRQTEICAKIIDAIEPYYQTIVVINEEFGEVSSSRCDCEPFYMYDGLCKHCVAALFAYINHKRRMEKGGDEACTLKTSGILKNMLNQYAMRADAAYLLPPGVSGKVELVPYFKSNYGVTAVEFKIGIDQKYVLKNITGFLNSLNKSENISYGRRLEFCHCMEAFTETSQRMVRFLQQQETDRKRQSRSHVYETCIASYERIMELDELGVDRFFEAVGTEPFSISVDYMPKKTVCVAEEEKMPKLHIRKAEGGIFLTLEKLQVIYGEKYLYFYQDSVIFRSKPELRGSVSEFFEFLDFQTGQECYIAEEELSVFCKDLLPLVKESFDVEEEDFDESLYVPPKPHFALYLDRQDQSTIGAKLLAIYGQKKYNVLEKMSPGEMRDAAEEFWAENLVGSYFNEYAKGNTIFVLRGNDDMLYRLLAGGLKHLSESMAIYTSREFRGLKVLPAPPVSASVSLKSDLLELEIRSPELTPEELAYLLCRYDRKKKYVRLKDGSFLTVGGSGIGRLAEISSDLRLTESKLKSGKITEPKYRALYLDDALRGGGRLSVEKNGGFRAIVQNMKTVEENGFQVPDSLKDIMRGYQKTGFAWLKTLRENGFGGILADDMGLGKTLQVISLLASEREDVLAGKKEWRQSLIVSPSSLIYNWQKEIQRFAPELETRIIAGTAEERKELVQGSGERQILITSYDLLKRDEALYQGRTFAVQVLDEAQYIKTPSTKAAKAVKKIASSFRLALTGTPIENRLSELWSIFDYLMPGFLYSYQRFREEMEVPIMTERDDGKMERLKRMIRPFILRRLKKDVLKDLPEKIEENVFAKISGEQLRLYDAHVQRMRLSLDSQSEEEFRENKIQILAELTKLRQICCDPALLFEHYGGEAAKTDVCLELIRDAVGSGHKVLLFSQFTSMLERLAWRLKKAGIAYYMLTGAVRKETRMQMVESFETDEIPVFCISLKAGGTGLNLTAADIVIHYDPWWNAAAQNQATDRAHRIGQQNVVTVYRLVAEGTIEEKILDLQERKRELAEQVLTGEGMGTGSFTREELLELLR